MTSRKVVVRQDQITLAQNLAGPPGIGAGESEQALVLGRALDRALGSEEALALETGGAA
jgi:hypothetical protein